MSIKKKTFHIELQLETIIFKFYVYFSLTFSFFSPIQENPFCYRISILRNWENSLFEFLIIFSKQSYQSPKIYL